MMETTEAPPPIESVIEPRFVAGANDWKFNTYDGALQFAIRVGTKAQPYRVHKANGSWWASRANRRAPVPTGPFPAKLRYR